MLIIHVHFKDHSPKLAGVKGVIETWCAGRLAYFHPFQRALYSRTLQFSVRLCQISAWTLPTLRWVWKREVKDAHRCNWCRIVNAAFYCFDVFVTPKVKVKKRKGKLVYWWCERSQSPRLRNQHLHLIFLVLLNPDRMTGRTQPSFVGNNPNCSIFAFKTLWSYRIPSLKDDWLKKRICLNKRWYNLHAYITVPYSSGVSLTLTSYGSCAELSVLWMSPMSA